jgi:hypothetical protein
MKKNNIKVLCAVAFTLVICSCEKKQPDTPNSDMETFKPYNVDFDKDGASDFTIIMSGIGTSDVPQSAGVRTFEIASADSNFLGLSLNADFTEYLYQGNEAISVNTNALLSYKYFGQRLYAREIKNGAYSTDWIIDPQFAIKKFIVYKKTKPNGTNKYGWVKLDFDISAKKLKVLDYFETSNVSFICGKK